MVQIRPTNDGKGLRFIREERDSDAVFNSIVGYHLRGGTYADRTYPTGFPLRPNAPLKIVTISDLAEGIVDETDGEYHGHRVHGLGMVNNQAARNRWSTATPTAQIVNEMQQLEPGTIVAVYEIDITPA